MPFANAYDGLPVLVTGHTGFKGSWLCEWLFQLGARVTGIALDPKPHEILFSQLKLGERISRDLRGDIRDLRSIEHALAVAKPKIVFHLAAQPLVRLSYDIPVDTFSVNVMGTVNVLEAVRDRGLECTIVCVTTDKCYENREWLHAYREEDAMGGYDPYSASKGCAELVIAAYRRSYFSDCDGIRLASARAGNVIGGGDWASDRVVPDCMRAARAHQPILIRNRFSTRPWQHVLEPLSGYLWLGACLSGHPSMPPSSAKLLASAFNFGPSVYSNRSVEDLVQEIVKHTSGQWIDATDPSAVHEASKLNLAIDKAFHLLAWHPTWDFRRTVAETVRWYMDVGDGVDTSGFTVSQINSYCKDARALGNAWAID